MSAALDRDREEAQRQTTVPEQFEEVTSELSGETRWGNDVNARDDHGSTPLMHAACIGCVEIVRLLIERGADVNARRQDGLTPLLLAAFFGHRDIVQILLESGADVDATSRYETSAEMWAAARGFFTVSDLIRETRTRTDGLESVADSDTSAETMSEEAIADRNLIEESSSSVVSEADTVTTSELIAQEHSSEPSDSAEPESVREATTIQRPTVVTHATTTVVMSVEGGAREHRTSASSRFAQRFSEDGMPIVAQQNSTVDNEQSKPAVEEPFSDEAAIAEPRNSEQRISSIISEEWYEGPTLEKNLAEPESSAIAEEASSIESNRPIKRGTRVLDEDWEPYALPLTNPTDSNPSVQKKPVVLDEDWEPTLPPVESFSDFHPVMTFVTRIAGTGRTLALLLVMGVIVSSVLAFVFLRISPQINAEALLPVEESVPPQQVTFENPPSTANADAAAAVSSNERTAPLQTATNETATSAVKNETAASTASDNPGPSDSAPANDENASVQPQSSETVTAAVGLDTIRRNGIRSIKPKHKTPPPPTVSEAIEPDKQASAASNVQQRTSPPTAQNSAERTTVDSSATGITSSKTRPKVIQWP